MTFRHANGRNNCSANARARALIAGILILAAGCGGKGAGSKTAASASSAVMSVSGAKVKVEPMRSELSLLGTTVAFKHIMLRAPSAGTVVGLNLESGNPVSRGQVVGEIINREVQAAKNGLEIARQLDPNSAKALADSIKPYIGQMGVPITVPQAGVVANRLASSGQMVNDLDPLADIIDPSSIYVDAVVPVDDLNWIKPGMSASVVSPLDPSNYIQARVAALSPSFSQSGATESARVEFTGAKRIAVAGAPVEVTVTIRYIPDALVVPEPALFEDAADDQYYVFVAGSDGYARRIRVGIGIRNPGKVQITAGLKPGYIVITSGGYALSNGLKVSVAVAH